MIVFDLSCRSGHRFEAWFASSDAYASQRERGLVSCPTCGDTAVDKAPMAPAVGAKGNRSRASADQAHTPVANALPPKVVAAMQALAAAQARALESSTYVGDKFAETSRAMHYGEREHAVVHGRATAEEAKALVEEGVPVAPLPFPVAPPDEIN
ncbi:DUF1178 family protein [Tsuneonella amylolytica]|uniref:DUF1178 family protein n=1 Tax=Tsuneonella amylolytica TaxID=2338327 RepID=UPI000EAA9D7E|nr:DUF1178 family protein [Tsuneonella amylolytica]